MAKNKVEGGALKRRVNGKQCKNLVPDEVVRLEIEKADLPKGAVLSSYEKYFHQELIIKKHTICFERARYKLPDGKYITANLPEHIKAHFGPGVQAYIIKQYHINNVPQDKLEQDLCSMGVQISAGTISSMLDNAAGKLKDEHEGILEAAKSVAQEIRVDDTSGQHGKLKHIHTVIQNDFFTYIQSAPSKSRRAFLETLQGKKRSYVLNKTALDYVKFYNFKAVIAAEFEKHLNQKFNTKEEYIVFLRSLKIDPTTTGKKILQAIEEALLLGGLVDRGLNPKIILLSDGAAQFRKIGLHALCWVHAERAIKKLVAASPEERAEIDRIIDEIWSFYQNLKEYKINPNKARAIELENQFDALFTQSVENERLRQELCTFISNKESLLRVLEHPFIDIHNNSSERDIRSVVVKRNISGPTRSTIGQEARNIFTSIFKTCLKLGISPIIFVSNKIQGRPQKTLYQLIIDAHNEHQYPLQPI